MKAGGVLAIFLACAALMGCATEPVVTSPPSDARAPGDRESVSIIRALGRDGDWVVIRGYHLSDHFVATVTNAPFSHAAMLDLERGEVIEAEAKGIHVTPLEEFVAKSHRLMLVRPMWGDAAGAKAALARARGLVGREYDFLGLIGVNIPDRYYCTELTLEAYRPLIPATELIPRPIEPGKLHYWGRVLYDSGPR
jgi:hypothetical protein